MAHPRKYTRPALTILALLLAGAVINVFVAWACARWGDHGPKGSQTDWTPATDLPSVANAYINDAAWVARYPNRKTGCDMSLSRSLAATRIEFMRWFDAREMAYSRSHTLVQFGWPCRSMQYAEWGCHVESAWPNGGSSRMEGPAGGWPFVTPAEQTWGERYRPSHVYPLTSISIGCAANTLFYALFVFAILLAPRMLRRSLRRRRALCTTCGYPAGVSPICTECGAKRCLPGDTRLCGE